MRAIVTTEAHRDLAAALADDPRLLPCMAGEPLSDDVSARAVVAEQVCPSCTVLELCRAAGESERFGVWGGIDRTSGAVAHTRARRKVKQ